MDERLAAAIAELRQVPPADPEARRRLSVALAAQAPAGAPRLLVLRPWRALAAAALLVAVTSGFWIAVGPRSGPQLAPAPDPATTPVQFVFVAPGARSVALVGDFNQWNPAATPLADDGGVWSVVVPLGRGTFTYSFVVDGREWRADPAAPSAPNDYGHPSSVVYVAMEP